MKRVLTPVLVLAGVQVLLVAGYMLFGGSTSGRDAADTLARAQPLPLDGPAPELRYRTRTGNAFLAAAYPRPWFWLRLTCGG